MVEQLSKKGIGPDEESIYARCKTKANHYHVVFYFILDWDVTASPENTRNKDELWQTLRTGKDLMRIWGKDKALPGERRRATVVWFNQVDAAARVQVAGEEWKRWSFRLLWSL